jgi:hypothetical protein
MNSYRKTALAAGVLYLITFVAIGTLFTYGSVLQDPSYILGLGSDTGLRWGALLEVIVGLAGVGTALALFPLVKRQNEAFALGFVTTRVIECAVIFVGVLSMLSIANLHTGPGATVGLDRASLGLEGASQLGTYKASFLLGQTLMPGMNALMLGYVMFKSRLVPRIIPALGLIGGPLMISSAAGQIVGINEQYSLWSGIALIPIFVWELSLGLWMTFKGFNAKAPLLALGNDDTSRATSVPSHAAVVVLEPRNAQAGA